MTINVVNRFFRDRGGPVFAPPTPPDVTVVQCAPEPYTVRCAQ